MAKDTGRSSKEKGPKQKNETLRVQLENERNSFDPHWRDIGDYIRPYRIRFNVEDANRGERKDNKIIDSHATLASRTLRSGMMAGVTSPARPWFNLTVSDQELAEFLPVKMWLEDVTARIHTIFLRSNLYNGLPVLYGDVGDFGTGAMLMEENLDEVVRFFVFPVGSFYLANDKDLEVKTFFRKFRMTVSQVVEKFGLQPDGSIDWDNISSNVKSLWEQYNRETWVDIYHVIKPNPDFDPNKLASKYKRYISQYYETSVTGTAGNSQTNVTPGGEDDNKFLSEKGYNHFPILAPRWEIAGEDVYGTSCPGMTCLGDVKSLQTMQKRKAQAVEKQVNPPMTGPSSLRNSKASILPGDITYDDTREGQKGFRPVHEVRPQIQEILLDIDDHRRRISRCYFEDLFLMLSQTDRRDITAREVEERHEEKLLALGPVLEQLNEDLLDPLVENTFNFAFEQGLLPKPPRELQGSELKIEYVSVMAQAQKLAGINNIERFTQYVGQLANLKQDPTVWYKVNTDNMIDDYGERIGVGADVIMPDEVAQEARVANMQAQQQAVELEALNKGADTAKKLSEAELDNDNALNRLTSGAGR